MIFMVVKPKKSQWLEPLNSTKDQDYLTISQRMNQRFKNLAVSEIDISFCKTSVNNSSQITASMLPASMRNIGRVLGGEVKNEPIPWQVSIGQRVGGYGDYEHICGGAILDMHTVITAAQCIAFRNTYEMFVLAGTSSLNTTIKPIQIQETLINLEHVYDFLTLEHDIVVIKTKEPLNQNNMKVEPICLPSSNKPVTEGSQCFVSGWGKMSKQSKLRR